MPQAAVAPQMPVTPYVVSDANYLLILVFLLRGLPKCDTVTLVPDPHSHSPGAHTKGVTLAPKMTPGMIGNSRVNREGFLVHGHSNVLWIS